MNKARSMCVVLVVLLAGVGMGQELAKPVIQSTCLVKVPQDNEQMAIVGSLAGTADVAGKAAQEVLGLTVAPHVGWDRVSPGVVRLVAQLPQDASAKASAFWNAVGVHLSKALRQVYEEQVDQIRTQVGLAERQKAEALARLQPGSSMNASDQAVQEQLGQMTDLSGLTRGMSIRDAIDALRESANPPLKLTVLWADLKDKGDIGEGTPIDIDGVNPMKLETGLRLLLKVVSDRGPGGERAIDYTIDGGVIIIATKETLQSLHKESSAGPEGPLSVDDLAIRKKDLVSRQEGIETDLLRLRARRQAIEEQAAQFKKRIDEGVNQDALVREIQRLVDVLTENEGRVRRMVEAGTAQQGQVAEAVEKLVKAKIELARQREATVQSAGGDQLTKLGNQLSSLSIELAELEATLPAIRAQLGQVEAQLSQVVSSMPQRIERDLAMKSLRQAEERLQDLKQKLANLQAPTVTVIGAGE